jgi:hypothetical protein
VWLFLPLCADLGSLEMPVTHCAQLCHGWSCYLGGVFYFQFILFSWSFWFLHLEYMILSSRAPPPKKTNKQTTELFVVLLLPHFVSSPGVPLTFFFGYSNISTTFLHIELWLVSKGTFACAQDFTDLSWFLESRCSQSSLVSVLALRPFGVFLHWVCAVLSWWWFWT